jgi:hypothetical protein
LCENVSQVDVLDGPSENSSRSQSSGSTAWILISSLISAARPARPVDARVRAPS